MEFLKEVLLGLDYTARKASSNSFFRWGAPVLTTLASSPICVWYQKHAFFKRKEKDMGKERLKTGLKKQVNETKTISNYPLDTVDIPIVDYEYNHSKEFAMETSTTNVLDRPGVFTNGASVPKNTEFATGKRSFELPFSPRQSFNSLVQTFSERQVDNRIHYTGYRHVGYF